MLSYIWSIHITCYGKLHSLGLFQEALSTNHPHATVIGSTSAKTDKKLFATFIYSCHNQFPKAFSARNQRITFFFS